MAKLDYKTTFDTLGFRPDYFPVELTNELQSSDMEIRKQAVHQLVDLIFGDQHQALKTEIKHGRDMMPIYAIGTPLPWLWETLTFTIVKK